MKHEAWVLYINTDKCFPTVSSLISFPSKVSHALSASWVIPVAEYYLIYESSVAQHVEGVCPSIHFSQGVIIYYCGHKMLLE